MLKWIKRLWGDIRASIVSKIVEALLGGAIVTALIAAIRKFADSPISWGAILGIFVVSFICLAIIFYLRRKSAKLVVGEGRGTQMTTNLVVFLPILIGLAFCVWAYIVGKKVFQISKDVELMQARMVRYVLPRTVTEEQKKAIAEFLLSKNRPHQVTYKVISRNEEASSFRADIQQALERGGWPTVAIIYADDIPEDFGIEVVVPQQQSPETPFERLHPKPNPGELLREAFNAAHIPVRSMGGAGGGNIQETTITIRIGARRRDKWAVLPKNLEKYNRTDMPPNYPEDEDY